MFFAGVSWVVATLLLFTLTGVPSADPALEDAPEASSATADVRGYDVVLSSSSAISDPPQVVYAEMQSRAEYVSAIGKFHGRATEIVPRVNKLAHTTRATSSEPDTATMWNFNWLRPDAVFPYTEGEGVTVAVVDTGVAPHIDMPGRLLPGADFIAGSGDGTADRMGHGTHVAGIIAAAHGNGIGIAGFAPQVSILPVVVLDATGYGSDATVAQGVRFATNTGVDVINLSLGDTVRTQVLADAVDYALSQNVIVVAAAGNNGSYAPFYPASQPGVVAVGATASAADDVAMYSNRADYLAVSAPGSWIQSTFPGDRYIRMSGTSMAAPHVSALAALLASKYPSWTPTQVINQMKSTADDVGAPGFDTAHGHGRVNFAAALSVPPLPPTEVDPFPRLKPPDMPPLPPLTPPTAPPLPNLPSLPRVPSGVNFGVSLPESLTFGLTTIVAVQSDSPKVTVTCTSGPTVSSAELTPTAGRAFRTIKVDGHTSCTAAAGANTASDEARVQIRTQLSGVRFGQSSLFSGVVLPALPVIVYPIDAKGQQGEPQVVEPNSSGLFTYTGTTEAVRIVVSSTEHVDGVDTVIRVRSLSP